MCCVALKWASEHNLVKDSMGLVYIMLLDYVSNVKGHEISICVSKLDFVFIFRML